MNIFKKYRDAEISTKITVIYSACFFLLLLIINAVMYFGIFHTLYNPAENTIKRSMLNVQELLTTLESLDRAVVTFDPNSIREPLITGVVLRVVDDDGNVFVDTDPNYPSVKMFDDNIMNDPPVFADNDMEVAVIGNASVYRAKMDYTHAGEHVTMQFFRTITSQGDFINDLEKILLFLDVLGIIAAVFIGNFVSRKILRPIKTMTDRAKNITFGKMEGRIPIPNANDELTELAKTFNAMLDRVQGGISQQEEVVSQQRDVISKQQQLVSTASHELRNPATVIIGYIDFLETYGINNKTILEESISAIRSEAYTMKDLLERLLHVARTDQKRQTINKENFDLSEIVGDLMKKMQLVAKTHNVELTANDSAQIYADKTAISQMLRNFLDNAVKYTPIGGNIKVNSVIDGNIIKLSISDTGIGIAPEHIDKIFDRFFVVNKKSPVSNAKSTGLGLYIVKEVADKHDIVIDIESAVGKGTTFTLKIPIASQQ